MKQGSPKLPHQDMLEDLHHEIKQICPQTVALSTLLLEGYNKGKLGTHLAKGDTEGSPDSADFGVIKNCTI